MHQGFAVTTSQGPSAPARVAESPEPDRDLAAATRIRESVAQTYAHASGPAAGLQIAGYEVDAVEALPDGASREFLGCGNPLAFAAVERGQTVLDLGSGAGIDLILASQKVGPEGRVIGVDMTDAMIDRARRNVTKAGLQNVEIHHGLIENLPVATASVDWVISNCVISLSPQKERVFAEIFRVLRPGGQMLISDIVVDEKLAVLLRRMTTIAPSIAGARTEREYLGAMAMAGLRGPEVRGRFVYEAEHLLGMFGNDTADRELAKACPFASASLGARLVRRSVLGVGARWAAGHVWSAKFHAQRPAGASDGV
jgi:SAM-dependent methyltransferase